MNDQSKNGCLASLGQLLILGIVLAVLYAMATHESRWVRLIFWALVGIVIYYGWIEPSINPEPEMYTKEWYLWKWERYK
jgi:hypothetical protein